MALGGSFVVSGPAEGRTMVAVALPLDTHDVCDSKATAVSCAG